MPWSAERAFAVRGALPGRFRAAVDLGGGCGLRQGEIFGLPVDEIDFDSGWLHVVNQVKVTKQGLVFAPPKRNKLRDVRMPDRVAHVLKLHMDAFPRVEVTLPWLRPDGPLVTRRLLFTRLDGAGAIRRTDFNHCAWKPALVAAGVIPAPKRGERYRPPASTVCTRSGGSRSGLHAPHAEQRRTGQEGRGQPRTRAPIRRRTAQRRPGAVRRDGATGPRPLAPSAESPGNPL